MQRRLNEQIVELETKIIALKRELRDAALPAFQRSERELDLTNAQETLTLLRRALDREHKM